MDSLENLRVLAGSKDFFRGLQHLYPRFKSGCHLLIPQIFIWGIFLDSGILVVSGLPGARQSVFPSRPYYTSGGIYIRICRIHQQDDIPYAYEISCCFCQDAHLPQRGRQCRHSYSVYPGCVKFPQGRHEVCGLFPDGVYSDPHR